MRPLGGALLLCLAAGLSAQTISLGEASKNAGETVNLSIQFNPESAAVAGVQFDILYDPAQFTITPSAGAAAKAAGKGVSMARPVPGDLRVIIAGLNQNAIASGVIADLAVHVAANAKPNAETIRFDATSAADPNGKSLELRAKDGSVKVESRRNEQ
jgi:hypothetical protein